MIGIYKITSPTGKVYIGQSWDIRQRWRAHRSKHKGNKGPLYASFVKHTTTAHRFEIVHCLPKDVDQTIMDSFECFYISQYRECGIVLLNLKEGGVGGRHSKESRAKMKISQSNISEETKAKMRESNRAISPEKRDFMKLSHRGQNKGNKHALGHRHTPEALSKIKFHAKNKSPETRKKQVIT